MLDIYDLSMQLCKATTDCKAAMDLTNSGEACINEFGQVLVDIANFFIYIKVFFNFVFRDFNKVVHDLDH